MGTGADAPRDADRVLSVEPGPEVETRVRGSRFIGQALPAGSVDDAGRLLAAIRRRYHDATHHCWALRLAGPGEPEERCDDAGEPSGTAGAPILSTLRHAGLLDTLCVVTRYFGGTKLGTGGLARAYAEAARRALEAAPRREVWRTERVLLRCEYERLGAVEAALARAGDALVSVDRAFDPAPRLTLEVKSSRLESLVRTLTDATAGEARIERLPGDDR